MRVSLEWFYENLKNLEFYESCLTSGTRSPEPNPLPIAESIFINELRRIDSHEIHDNSSLMDAFE